MFAPRKNRTAGSPGLVSLVTQVRYCWLDAARERSVLTPRKGEQVARLRAILVSFVVALAVPIVGNAATGDDYAYGSGTTDFLTSFQFSVVETPSGKVRGSGTFTTIGGQTYSGPATCMTVLENAAILGFRLTPPIFDSGTRYQTFQVIVRDADAPPYVSNTGSDEFVGGLGLYPAGRSFPCDGGPGGFYQPVTSGEIVVHNG